MVEIKRNVCINYYIAIQTKHNHNKLLALLRIVPIINPFPFKIKS